MKDLVNPRDITKTLGSIFEEYLHDKTGIEQIAEYLDEKNCLMNHFFNGNGRGTYMTRELFAAKGAVSSLNSEYWSRVMAMTDIVACMPAVKRNEWSTMIH